MLGIRPIEPAAGDAGAVRRALFVVAGFVAVLWWIKLIEFWLDAQFAGLGVFPRELSGLVGVLTAPLIHGSFEHLAANTPALLLLGTALLYGYPRSCWAVLLVVWLGSGLGVWLSARGSYHFGASGLTHGLFFYIFIVGVLRRDARALVLAMAAFFLYGGMVWGIFPREPGVSFESHFWGAAMGALCAVALRKRDPAPPVKRYDWENEAEETEDPFIGDAWKVDPEHQEPPRSRDS